MDKIKIHDCHNNNTIFNTDKWIKYTEEVRKIIDKQNPIKPKILNYEPLLNIGWKYGCPSCNCAVGVNSNAFDYTQEDEYCPSCGQKIDWK